MEPVHGYETTNHHGKDADNAINEDGTAESSKYSKSSSSLSSYSSATYESPLQTASPVQAPDVQIMERPEDIARDRIPASVFESKPSTPTAWSAVSNESLFSIQIGTHSFSRDQFLTMSEDKFDELFKSGELRKSAELIWSRLHNESPIGILHDTNDFDMGKKYEEKDEILKDSSNENFNQPKNGVPQVEGSRDSATNYCQQFDESGISCQPLAFPEKKKRSGWRLLWPCSFYSWDVCLCVWSSFWCKWPSWNCCSMRQRCCCSKPSCCFKWPTCCCNWPRCSCNWPCCGCNRPSCGCKWPCCGCKWPGCGCNWPGCSCTWPSCSCCTWPSCSCCKWPRSCCKFHYPSFNCNCSSFSWSFCYPWNCCRRKSYPASHSPVNI
ncbi:uncharacterized protein LOC141723024 isoform X2 [Apium graveolens]